MLISAGSFLYVATMHILPEAYSSNDEAEHEQSKVSLAKQIEYDSKHFSKPIELMMLMTGIYLPMLL